MKQKSVFFILLFITANVFAQKNIDKLLKTYNSHSIPYISVEELRMLQMNDSVIILDSREPVEYEVSHIVSSNNVGYNDFTSGDKQIQKLSKNTLIVVYCSVGIRSEQIGEKLKKEGFTKVKNLYGGIFEWKNKGYPVIDSTEMETERIHTFSKMWSNYLHAGTPVY